MRRIVYTISNLFIGLIFLRFSISKLLGFPSAVKGFEDMAKPLHIDPDLFRFGIGSTMLVVCISCLLVTVLSFFRSLNNKMSINLGYVSSVGVILSMIGAMFSELFLRTNPVWPLFYLGGSIVLLGLYNILILKETQRCSDIKC
ncbi:hypothetical protein K5X82_11130 [Halosquirtibacter xylanolyticus]|uniref:hypothetical protein n=1 Tax=Halosquirtibacter xylanolyticus TaxID=3374599 RepID=UPI003749E191|nr:hypothetical protein K5X82_11130 [Prolixibacteraceae bacterium]